MGTSFAPHTLARTGKALTLVAMNYACLRNDCVLEPQSIEHISSDANFPFLNFLCDNDKMIALMLDTSHTDTSHLC